MIEAEKKGKQMESKSDWSDGRGDLVSDMLKGAQILRESEPVQVIDFAVLPKASIGLLNHELVGLPVLADGKKAGVVHSVAASNGNERLGLVRIKLTSKKYIKLFDRIARGEMSVGFVPVNKEPDV